LSFNRCVVEWLHDGKRLLLQDPPPGAKDKSKKVKCTGSAEGETTCTREQAEVPLDMLTYAGVC
jgi:hypothetical protein